MLKKNDVLFCTANYSSAADACRGKREHNPYHAELMNDSMRETLDSIKRIDKKGTFYEMDYTADYYDPVITNVAEKLTASIDTGCSAFSAYNTSRKFLLCRNYDYLHKDAVGNITGLHVLLRTAPKGKLRSIGVCDAYWLNPAAYYTGAPDDGKTDISLLLMTPYMCVDAMNEAGLTVSLLVTDLKTGEFHTNQHTKKKRKTHSILLRHIIDHAHNIREAEEIAGQFDVYSVGDTDLHLYLCEKNGCSAVFEWRQCGNDRRQKLYVTYTNAVTNFFVGFDDGENVRNKDGSLKELCAKLMPTFNNYKYGYGHGYHRFNQIVAALERYIEADKNEYGIRNSVMEDRQVLDVLRTVSQNPGTEKTSFTQYSAIYNLKELSVRFYLQMDYEKVYAFQL